MSLQSLEGDDYLSILEKVMGKVLVGVKKGGLEGKGVEFTVTNICIFKIRKCIISTCRCRYQFSVYSHR